MVFENLVVSEIGIGEIVKVFSLLLLGIVIALVVNFFIKKIATLTLYPWVRKSSPGIYKRTVSGVNLFALIIQWLIILLFVFQILSIFQIYLLDEILKTSVKFLPKLALAFLIIVIGLIITSILSRKIYDMDFNNSEVFAKLFEIVFIFATILSALEIVSIKVTPFVDIFKVGLYALGFTFAIAIGIALGIALKPEVSRLINSLKKSESK